MIHIFHITEPERKRMLPSPFQFTVHIQTDGYSQPPGENPNSRLHFADEPTRYHWQTRAPYYHTRETSFHLPAGHFFQAARGLNQP